MRVATMRRVAVPAKLESMEDLDAVAQRRLTPDQVRTVEVQDAPVDTGATYLSVPRRLIKQLGLRLLRTRRTKTAVGVIEVGTYGTVQLTVQGRDCVVQVAEVPDECPVIIGQVPLEMLDFVVDPIKQQLIGNPEHGGEQMLEMY